MSTVYYAYIADKSRRNMARKKFDPAKHFEPSDFKRVSFPKLKPSTKTISIRLPEGMLDRLKMLANKRDVPYQSYIKIILDDKIESEMRK